MNPPFWGRMAQTVETLVKHGKIRRDEADEKFILLHSP